VANALDSEGEWCIPTARTKKDKNNRSGSDDALDTGTRGEEPPVEKGKLIYQCDRRNDPSTRTGKNGSGSPTGWQVDTGRQERRRNQAENPAKALATHKAVKKLKRKKKTPNRIPTLTRPWEGKTAETVGNCSSNESENEPKNPLANKLYKAGKTIGGEK